MAPEFQVPARPHLTRIFSRRNPAFFRPMLTLNLIRRGTLLPNGYSWPQHKENQ